MVKNIDHFLENFQTTFTAKQLLSGNFPFTIYFKILRIIILCFGVNLLELDLILLEMKD